MTINNKPLTIKSSWMGIVNDNIVSLLPRASLPDSTFMRRQSADLLRIGGNQLAHEQLHCAKNNKKSGWRLYALLVGTLREA